MNDHQHLIKPSTLNETLYAFQGLIWSIWAIVADYSLLSCVQTFVDFEARVELQNSIKMFPAIVFVVSADGHGVGYAATYPQCNKVRMIWLIMQKCKILNFPLNDEKTTRANVEKMVNDVRNVYLAEDPLVLVVHTDNVASL